MPASGLRVRTFMSRKIATKATAPSWCDQPDILRAASHSAKSTWHTTLWTKATRSMRSLRKTLSDLSSPVKMGKKTKVLAETVEKTLPRSLNRRLALNLLLARSGKRSSWFTSSQSLLLREWMFQAWPRGLLHHPLTLRSGRWAMGNSDKRYAISDKQLCA